MNYENNIDYARKLDQEDPLKTYRNKFYIPQHNSKDCIYFTGNSLGLQPKSTATYLQEELEAWKTLGVEGHFEGKRPWLQYHKLSKEVLAKIVGAKPIEVVAMNNLTSNLHFMMVSFYRPTAQRFKIIAEAGAFPSDQYALASQINFHASLPDGQGFDPKNALVELHPRAGEHTLRKEDILAKINEVGSELALVMMGGVQYYTGQFFDLKAITEAGHKVGAKVGFDLAHAVGNVPLHLHDHKVDFAVWCSYKYLNSGPGGISGVFVHENHAH
ncbi:MAG: kynureninase, partial [Cyclobacteriaceae bacterium]|nr:kynureninase [Cyclobacteriaceae bacterium]